MLCIPSSLNELLLLFRPCFTQPSFQTFTALVVGQIAQTRLRCVTGMLLGARLSRVWHHARAHRFFSHARWSADQLGLAVAALIVERLLPADAPLVVPVDDSLFKRRGRKVFGGVWDHDPAANSKHGSVAWGNSWVTAGINIKLPFLERTVCLLVLFRLWRPRHPEYIKAQHPDPQRPSKPQLAREIVCLLAERFPGRQIHVVGDSAYAAKAFAGLPANVTITARMRGDARLYEPAPPRTPTTLGRPRKKGQMLPKPDHIAADPTSDWQTITVRRYGKNGHAPVHSFHCLWYETFGQQPVQVVIVHNHAKPSGHELTLVSTDLNTTPQQLIERFADRWPIETAYEEAKQLFGVGQARNRTENAVRRTVPFQLLAMTLTTCWYALHGHHPDDVTEHRHRSPWYLTKTTPSSADMLAKLRRVIIANQFHPGRPTTPTHREITQVQQAWAAAGL
jgi:hypothetical protein